MNARCYCLIALCVLAGSISSANAQPLLQDALAIVADPVTLEREIQAESIPFEVYVVYLSDGSRYASPGALQFGLEVDPGLSVLGSSTAGLVIQPAPLEFVLAFTDCGGWGVPGAFVVLSLVVMRDDSAAPGAGVRLTGLVSSGDPMEATNCIHNSLFDLIDFGGVVVNPENPGIAGFASSPEYVVEGRDYTLGWSTFGGGDWMLDGVSVSAQASLQFTALSSAFHELSSSSTTSSLTVPIIQEPYVRELSATPMETPDSFRLTWSVLGANRVDITSLGQVAPHGSAAINSSTTPVLDLTATNEWGQVVEAIPLIAPTELPVINEFSFYPEAPEHGAQVALSYDVDHAVELRIDPVPGRVPVGQRQVVLYPTTGETYTLTATNAIGSATRQLTVPGPIPHISVFHLVEQYYGPTMEVHFDYAVSGADSVWMEPTGELEGASGVATVISPVEPMTYFIHAENEHGHSSRSVLLTPIAPILFSSGSWSRYVAGQPVTVRWSTAFAASVYLLPDSIPLTPTAHGERLLDLEPGRTYQLVAENAVGRTIDTHRVDYREPIIVEFRLDPTPGVVNQEFDVVWKTIGATEMAIGGIPGFELPDTAIPDSGRVTHSISAPSRDRPVLWTRNSRGATSVKYLWPRLDVRAADEVLSYFHAWNPTPDPGESTGIMWDGRAPTARLDGESVAAPGARQVTPPLGTSFHVLEMDYLSATVVDTAWITVNPITSFEVVGPIASETETILSVFPGELIQLAWETPGADRVTLEPGIGEVDPTGGTAEVTIIKTTDFVLSAWYGGHREVIERSLHVSEPIIDDFSFSKEVARPDEPVTLRWAVRGADEIRIYGPDGTRIYGAADVDSLQFATPPYGSTWELYSYNEEGSEYVYAAIVEPYAEIHEFYADPPVIVRGESTTLRWDVSEVDGVEIETVGTFPPQGDYLISPLESRGFALRGEGTHNEVFRIAPVRVDISADRPATIMVSAQPDSYDDNLLPDVEGEQSRYVAWVRIENVLGEINHVDFAVEIPDWLEVERVHTAGEAAAMSKLESHFWVRLADCVPGELHTEWLARISLKQIAPPPAGELPQIRIHTGPAPGSNLPVSPGWQACGDSIQFQLDVPGMVLNTAGPVYFMTGPVPVRLLGLSTRWIEAGLEMSWADPRDASLASLDLYRGRAPGELAFLRSVHDSDSWIDNEAAELFEGGPLFYQLVGRTGEDVMWQSVELEIREAPPSTAPSRTRLVGARPNPFNPRTTIYFDLAHPDDVTVSVYDLAGRRVREWVLRNQLPGRGQVIWDGDDRHGRRASSGVYLVRLQADGIVDTKRVTLLK